MSQNLPFYNPARNQWYIATSPLGRGGQGVVWSGSFGSTPCAIKVQTDIKAWELEQSIHLACFGHKFIVTAYDQFMASDGSLILVMERAEGSAQQLVDAGTRFTPMQVCRIGADLASALETIHAQGIRHRDITLKNVLHFGKGVFKLGDFGIARRGMAPDELAMTQVGTPGWFAPEVLKGEGSTPSSDVYQLGLVLLSLLLGRHLIPPTYTRQQMWDAILNGVPRLTAEQVIATHGETAKIIRNMLPRTPSLRHTSASMVRLAFQAEYQALKARDNVTNALMARPWTNGIAGLFSQFPPQRNALAAIAKGGINLKPQVNALARAASPHPAVNGLLGWNPIPNPVPNVRRPSANGLLGALPSIKRPQLNGLLGLEPLPNVRRPALQGALAGAQPVKPNVALGGLLGLGALAAAASGNKPLGGLLGLGALAALASDPNAKPSS